MVDLASDTMAMTYVKTADLAGRDPKRDKNGHAQWVFCASCYGNEVTSTGATTDKSGGVCKQCDGSGALWIVEDTG
jgi:hypothetical protein